MEDPARKSVNGNSDSISEVDRQDRAKHFRFAIDGIGDKRKELYWMPWPRCALVRPQRLILRDSSSKALENPCSMRWGRPLSYCIGLKKGEGGSIQCTITLCSLQNVEKWVWPWKCRWFDIYSLILVFGGKNVWAGYGRPLLLLFSGTRWYLSLTEHQSEIWWSAQESCTGGDSDRGESPP